MNHDSINTTNLTKHFLCCTPINTIDIFVPKQSINYFIKFDKQQEILQNTVNSDLIKKYPVKRSYQKAFLKWLMSKIEEEGGEIYDSIYTAYCKLISASIDESIHYRHFLIQNECISIQESTNIISEGTTGLCSWQGAAELSKWCIENKNKFCEKVILELGCGVGLTGLCIIKKCSPKQYIFTDCHKTVLEMVSENVKLNLFCKRNIQPLLNNNRLKLQITHCHTDVKVMELRWEDINKYINEQWIIPDIIIGADILYDADLFYSLVLGLKTILSFNDRYAIIAATIRNVDTFSHFVHHLEHHNLSFEEYGIPQQMIHISLTDLPIKILKIFQKR
ncbi:Protein-lysine N-methyltransferase EEF2KMT [Anthophora quadrimaculata]